MAARTAVVAGTATAVSGRVAHRQAQKYDQQAYEQQQAAAQQQAATPPPPPPAQPAGPAEDEATAQLKNLANLHSQGILTDEEFAAAKAKVLGI